jgi:hypothetical protein
MTCGQSRGGDQLAPRGADVRVQVVPGHHDRAVEVPVGGATQRGVVALGEAASLVLSSTVDDRADDEPAASARLDADQAGE